MEFTEIGEIVKTRPVSDLETTYHVVIAHSYRNEEALPLDWWVENGTEDAEDWWQEYIEADPAYIHNTFRELTLPETTGIFHLWGTSHPVRDWETGIVDDIYMSGQCEQIHEVVEHEED